jgi:hypothetical protein
MRELRIEFSQEVVLSPWTAEGQPTTTTERRYFFTDGGAIASYETVRRSTLPCGCVNQTAGGFCAVCGRLTCSHCLRYCENCGKPLCPRHAVERHDTGGEEIPLCKRCHRRIKSKRIVRGLLSPFVTLKE